jgi:zinc transport system substrate-binding protein
MEEGGKEPSPAHLARLAEIAGANGICTIYIQSEFDKEVAAAFAREIKGDIVQIWPLNPFWAENMISMARALSENP